MKPLLLIIKIKVTKSIRLIAVRMEKKATLILQPVAMQILLMTKIPPIPSSKFSAIVFAVNGWRVKVQ